MNSLRIHRLLKLDVQLIVDDEKYFTFASDTASNRSFYTLDRSTTSNHVKFKYRAKFEPKLSVWVTISSEGISRLFIHRSKLVVNTKTYLNECIQSD